MTDKKLFLIDGHALIFKMYYAFLRRPMINSKGMDMSILFGCTKYILELIEREQPTHIAVAFDPPGGTFRNKMFPEYKANRSETPQLVIDALEPLQKLCESLNIKTMLVPNYEADDVIGTVSKKFGAQGVKVFMVTPDKDYGQLIDDNITQIKPGKSGGENEIVDKAAICGKYGLSSPLQVIEMLTICGDTADNVPGVKGVGEKGAEKLISKYGSVAGIYEHIEELPERQKLMFKEAESHIELSHTLVTINTEVPYEVELSDMEVNRDFRSEAWELFDYYEFNSLKKYLGKDKPGQKAEKTEFVFEKTDAHKICDLAVNAGRCSILTVTDTDGIFAKAEQLFIGVTLKEKTFISSGGMSDFRVILEDGKIEKCGYDLKLQLNILANNGLTLNGKLLDIELMHYLVNPERNHNLDSLCQSYLGFSLDEEVESASLFDSLDKDYGKNNEKEAAITSVLAGKVWDDILNNSLSELYDKMEEPLIRVLGRMERNGVKLDLSQLKDFADNLRKEAEALESKIKDVAEDSDLNVSSPKQIGILLFEKLNLDSKAKKNKNGSYSTDEATLLAIADRHPVINDILEFRGIKKLLSTYIEPFPDYISKKTGKVHTTFNQALAATGRLSSSNPNLQNIPIRTERGKEMRKAFVPETSGNVIMSADYSQIELRIMAHLSGDAHLIEAFNHNIDVHAATASKIFGIPYEEVSADQRRIAKTANFGIMYGISAFGLSQRLNITRAEAKKIIEDYFEAFPTIRNFIDNTIKQVQKDGFVSTLFGRRRYIPDINSNNATVRALAERNAVNAPIQGTAADIIKLAMINIDREMTQRGLKSKMVLQIHDELVFDVPASEIEQMQSLVVDKMENVIKLTIPTTVECNYGKNWLEAH